MDVCENSPINKAHYYSRQADKVERNGYFDDASDFHEKAAYCLIEGLKLTNNKLALESLHLQVQYHAKKKDLLRLKKLQHQAIQEAMRVQKEAMSRVLKTKKKTEAGDGDETLQKAIYRTFEEADSLLELLVHKKDVTAKPAVESLPTGSTSGSKRPKDDTTVIEELRIVNYQLRSLITQLMTELAESEKQVDALKERVMELEASRKSSETPAIMSCEDLPPLDMPSFKVS